MVLRERERENVRLARTERHVPSVSPACDFLQGAKRGKRLPVYLKDE